MTNWLRWHHPDPDKLDTGTAASPAAAETITSTLKKAGETSGAKKDPRWRNEALQLLQ